MEFKLKTKLIFSYRFSKLRGFFCGPTSLSAFIVFPTSFTGEQPLCANCHVHFQVRATTETSATCFAKIMLLTCGSQHEGIRLLLQNKQLSLLFLFNLWKLWFLLVIDLWASNNILLLFTDM